MGADISHLKQNGAKTNPDLVIVPPPTSHPQVNHDPNRPNRSMPKSHTTHFSDFSMFPDRFNGSSKPKPVAIVTHGHEHHHEEQPHFSDYSLYPDKLDQHKLKMHRSLSETPPAKNMDMNVGTSLPATGFISKYNFRLRRNSESDHHETNESLATSAETEGVRARSLSNSKMYYFDFSLIPDKDPHCVIDERKKHQSDDKALPTVKEGCSSTSAPPASSIEVPKRARKTSEGRFGFFDYSMIPDKDPKCFGSKD